MFLSNIPYRTYTVIIDYYRSESEHWQEYWQLCRPNWTARETKMIKDEMHDALITDRCFMATAAVYYGEITTYSRDRRLMYFYSSAMGSYVWDSVYSKDGVHLHRWWADPAICG